MNDQPRETDWVDRIQPKMRIVPGSLVETELQPPEGYVHDANYPEGNSVPHGSLAFVKETEGVTPEPRILNKVHPFLGTTIRQSIQWEQARGGI